MKEGCGSVVMAKLVIFGDGRTRRDARDADFCTNYNRTLKKAFALKVLATLGFNFKLKYELDQQTHCDIPLQCCMCRSFWSPLLVSHVIDALILARLALLTSAPTELSETRKLS
jgi:hypothetical protein